jgi:hypothetical protein
MTIPPILSNDFDDGLAAWQRLLDDVPPGAHAISQKLSNRARAILLQAQQRYRERATREPERCAEIFTEERQRAEKEMDRVLTLQRKAMATVQLGSNRAARRAAGTKRRR